ncbi:MAG: LLM class F420-dependent oxidoreductase [Actinomycetota bacterium]
MKIGMMFANVVLFGTRDGARALAEAANESGIESLWTVEHVVVPEGYESPYPYSPSGKMPGPETSPIPDPLAWISFVGALTNNVKLATGILILPQRNPLILAKECATIDVLTNGRLILGVGIGWLAEEFEAIGVPFDERVDRTEEYVGALRALWSQDETFEGKFTSFTNARLNPKPVQSAGIPIVVGGHTKAAARRAGRIGDGFFPARPQNLEELIAECGRAATEAGRDPDAVEITTGGLPDPDFAKRLEDLGVHRMVIPPPSFDPSDIKRALGEVSEKLVAKVG